MVIATHYNPAMNRWAILKCPSRTEIYDSAVFSRSNNWPKNIKFIATSSMSKPNIDYEQFASTYAAHREASEAVVEHLVERMSDCDVQSVLEIGCGTGNHLAAVANQLNARGFGLDSSHAMLRECSDKHPQLSVQVGNAEDEFPFEGDSFDLCLSVDFIHYVNNLAGVFLEAHRVTKPSGKIVTVTDSEEDIRQRIYSQYFPACVDKELARYPTTAAIESAMRECGWRDIEVTHTARVFPVTSNMLDKIRNKAFTSLQLISDDCFAAGMARLEKDYASGEITRCERYTYVWGIK